MPEKMYIQEEELQRLLDDDNTFDETIDKYFDLDDSEAFKVQYKLKSNVELTGGSYTTKGIFRSIMILSGNFIMRRRRNRTYRRSIRDFPNRLRIVSEGDSWFQHPGRHDIIDNLIHKYSVKSLGAAGDDMEDYFSESEYLKEIEEVNPSYFLFSGGGNDMFAKGFDNFLNKYTEDTDNIGPKRFIKKAFFNKLDHLLELYETLFKEITRRFPSLTMLVHGYDYVIPRINGRWIGKHMDKKKIKNEDDQRGIIKIILKEFNDKLSALAHDFDNVEYVNLLGIVKDEWSDEIHPSDEGFQLAALKFIQRIIDVEKRKS